MVRFEKGFFFLGLGLGSAWIGLDWIGEGREEELPSGMVFD